MGGDRSRNRLGHSLSAMQVAPDRIPPADPEIHHAGNREHSFRNENFPEGILLPGLPLYLGERWRSAPAAGGLGNVQLTDPRFAREAPNPKLQAPGKHQIPSSQKSRSP